MFNIESRKELEAYHAMSEKNAEIAKNREEKRNNVNKALTSRAQSGEPQNNEAPPNQEPRTKNQEPRTNEPINNIGRFGQTDSFYV